MIYWRISKYETRLGLQCQTPLRSYPLTLISYPLSLMPYPLSLIPYALSLISYPLCLSFISILCTKNIFVRKLVSAIKIESNFFLVEKKSFKSAWHFSRQHFACQHFFWIWKKCWYSAKHQVISTFCLIKYIAACWNYVQIGAMRIK